MRRIWIQKQLNANNYLITAFFTGTYQMKSIKDFVGKVDNLGSFTSNFEELLGQFNLTISNF